MTGKREPRWVVSHACLTGSQQDWDGTPLCMRPDCGHRADHRIHALPDTPEEAREIDERRIGEGGK